MTQKRTMENKRGVAKKGKLAKDDSATMRVVIVTLDAHLASGVMRARKALARKIPELELSFHVAAEWANDPEALDRCRADIEKGDIIIAHMLFMEEHIEAVYPWLEARRDACDAMVGCMSAKNVAQLTKMGRFTVSGDENGLLSKLRGKKSDSAPAASAGAKQASMLRKLPKLLRFVPGTAQDLRAYFLTMQYWLAGSDVNVENMVTFLIGKYASGPRKALRGKFKPVMPVEYPAVGVYHPRLTNKVAESVRALPKAKRGSKGTVGLLLMRSYVLAGNTAHYDGVIASLEARGLRVIPAFASGLDGRPAVEQFFTQEGSATVDTVISLTGFSLVGGPAYSDAKAAEETLAALDVPYLAAQAVEFQSLERWEKSDAGLLPIEATMMVAIPELDGATGPIVFGGQSEEDEAGTSSRDMVVHQERADQLAARAAKLVALRRSERADRKVGIVLFNFPPNSGNTGTAMYLSVFESLFRTLGRLHDEGYSVKVPESVDALREQIVSGNSADFGTYANVHAQIPASDHVRNEPYLSEIEAEWGPAPGRELSDGSSIFVLGAQFGNVFVGLQPSPGYEGDPMRLLFEGNFAPTHAFSAFYRYLRDDFGASALLHFGTHGSLEFMPGKQSGLSSACWPDRLIGDMPNIYLYAANNPSEGVIAKRRAAATLVSYMTPPIVQAGLYRELAELKASVQRWRAVDLDDAAGAAEREELLVLIREQVSTLAFVGDAADDASAEQTADAPALEILRGGAAEKDFDVNSIWERLIEIEETLIPSGLHVVGLPLDREQRIDLLEASAANAEALVGLGGVGDAAAENVDAAEQAPIGREEIEALVDAGAPKPILDGFGRRRESARYDRLAKLAETNELLATDYELPAIVNALDGRFIRPAPGGDVLRSPEVLPTGRNVHGFDPFKMPTAFACIDGSRQADRLLDRHREDGHALPETIALVLWGSDNLKTEGASIAQALALMGAAPRVDSYGRLAGAVLIPLEKLGRPRIDVVMTLSGIFRDLFPFQTRLLAEAAYLAATAEEPIEQNFIRKHSLEYQAENGCDLEEAALRVFSNEVGAYGANVSNLVQDDLWSEEDELAEAYTQRKSFAYTRTGESSKNTDLLQSVLSKVELAYQNLESVDLGVTSVDVYFDNLGGMSRSIAKAGGATVPVYIGDQTHGEESVRTLNEQVALETRSRVLNPKWFEGMLKHGYEGVRQIESHVTNTLGWSATTGQVDRWVYSQIADTFVLDDAMRDQLAALNPTASARMANRLIEAQERDYWSPDEETLEALRRAGAELEDRLEGITEGVAAA